MTLPVVAGIELGGTKCVCILAVGPSHVLEQVTVPTQDPGTTLAAIEAVLDRWWAGTGFAALGLGAFGPINLDRADDGFGTILATPKPGWSGVNLKSRFSRRYAVPIHIETDVNGAALSEGRWGAAVGLRNYAYITVGTGIGAGIVVGGNLVGGPLPVEVGHTRVNRQLGDDWPGSCVFHGDCVEGLAAGPAIEARTGQRAAALGHDDPVWDLVSHALAAMLHNLVLTISPQRLLLGGGVITRQPHLIERICAELTANVAGYVDLSGDCDMRKLVQAPTLGAMAGPLGAIAIAMDALATPREHSSDC